MLIDETRDAKNSRSELRRFGIIMAVAFSLLGGALLWRHRNYHWYLFILSAIFLFLGLFLRVLLKPVFKLWMTLSHIMGWFMTRLILAILFYLVLTLLSLLIRMLGKDILDIKFARGSSDSYWTPRQIDESQKRDYKKQF